MVYRMPLAIRQPDRTDLNSSYVAAENNIMRLCPFISTLKFSRLAASFFSVAAFWRLSEYGIVLLVVFALGPLGLLFCGSLLDVRAVAMVFDGVYVSVGLRFLRLRRVTRSVDDIVFGQLRGSPRASQLTHA